MTRPDSQGGRGREVHLLLSPHQPGHAARLRRGVSLAGAHLRRPGRLQVARSPRCSRRRSRSASRKTRAPGPTSTTWASTVRGPESHARPFRGRPGRPFPCESAMTERVLLESARADAARLLAACYYEPMPAFEEEGVFEALSAAARTRPRTRRRGRGAGRRLRRRAAGRTAARLHAPVPRPDRDLAPPYGSVWLSGRAP